MCRGVLDVQQRKKDQARVKGCTGSRKGGKENGTRVAVSREKNPGMHRYSSFLLVPATGTDHESELVFVADNPVQLILCVCYCNMVA